MKINDSGEADFSSGARSSTVPGCTGAVGAEGIWGFYRRRGANLHMIKKTHRAKSLSDTREGRPDIGEGRMGGGGSSKRHRLLRLTAFQGENEVNILSVTTSAAVSEAERLPPGYASVLSLHNGNCSKRTLRLRGDPSNIFSFLLTEKMKVNICLHLIPESLKCH